MKKSDPHKTKNDNFMDAFKNALKGIEYTIKTQKNIRIQLVIAIIVILFAKMYGLNKLGFLYLTFAIFSVIFAEMINTAIEATVDLYVKEYNPIAKIAKDVAAGAVLIASINAVIVACLLFL